MCSRHLKTPIATPDIRVRKLPICWYARHLALIELSAALKLLVYLSLIACLFAPWGLTPSTAPALLLIGIAAYIAKLGAGGLLLALFETSIAKMRVFRLPGFLGAALMLALLAALLRFVSRSF